MADDTQQPQQQPQPEAPPANKHAPNLSKIGWGTFLAGGVLGLVTRAIAGSVAGVEWNPLWAIVGGSIIIGAIQKISANSSISVTGPAATPTAGITVQPQYQPSKLRQRTASAALPAGVEDVPDGAHVTPPPSPGTVTRSKELGG